MCVSFTSRRASFFDGGERAQVHANVDYSNLEARTIAGESAQANRNVCLAPDRERSEFLRKFSTSRRARVAIFSDCFYFRPRSEIEGGGSRLFHVLEFFHSAESEQFLEPLSTSPRASVTILFEQCCPATVWA